MVLIALVVVVGLPLARGQERRRAEGKPVVPGPEEVAAERSATAARAHVEDLERRKDERLAEIREAELDRLAGKLSRQDFDELERALRAEAVELMRELDAARAEQKARAEKAQAAQPPAGPAGA